MEVGWSGHAAPVAAFTLPLRIAGVDVLVELSEPVPWVAGRTVVLAAAGLPAGTELYLGPTAVGPEWVLGCPPLLAGTSLTRHPDLDEWAPAAVRLACVAGPDAGRWVSLDIDRAVMIGRGPAADLRLDDVGLSRRHARVQWTPTGIVVQRCADGAERAVATGTVFRLGSSLLRADLYQEVGLPLRPDGRGRQIVARPPGLAPPFHLALPPDPGPPPRRSRRPVPLLAALMAALVGVGIAVLTRMWMFLLLAALGPLTMLGSAVSDRITGRRSHRREAADHRDATAADHDALVSAMRADHADAWDRFADPSVLLARALAAGRRLWDRRPTDADFLCVAIGWGSRPARVDRPTPPEVAQVPIVLDLTRYGVIGVVGPVGSARPLLRFLLAQLAVFHAPSELRIVLCSDRTDLAALFDLPHLRRADGGAAVLTSPDDLERLTPPDAAPSTLLVLDGPQWRPAAVVRGWLERAATTAGPGRAVALCLGDDPADLPVECRAVLRVDGERVSGSSAGLETVVTGVDPDYLRRLGQALTALADQDDEQTQLPNQVWIQDVVGSVPAPDAVRAGWTHPGLEVALGRNSSGPVRLDLERDGPHLLLAGTTGAGKSELLRTLVLGLALASPPSRCSFLLIDYKGGAAFGPLVDLPHTTGVVTDLDDGQATRALRSLRGEIHRRERAITDAGVADLIALRLAQPGRAFPSLVLVVDEFATLAAELPEFLSGLLDVAQRGRSLGVHLVLGTQRPAGVLTPAMRANIGARICLRVTDPADSTDVIGVAVAAHIPVSVPGRAWLRVGSDPPVPFQTARVVASASGRVNARRRDTPAPAPSADPDPGPWLRAVQEAARDMPRPRPAWRPPLPWTLAADTVGDEVLAVLDRPVLGDHLPFLDPGGSTLITGPPGSGRTAALRRWARIQAAGGAVLLLVGPGGALGTWPGTLTGLDLTEPTLLHRLVHHLHQQLSLRRGPDDGPRLALLVDGLDQLLTALDQLDFGTGTALLSEVIGAGPAVGIRVGATGEPRLAQHRVAGHFGAILRLGMDERGDRRGKGPPGRGWIGDLEAQVVWDPPDRTAPPVRSDQLARARAAGMRVRPLPLLVEVGDLLPPRPEAIPLGLGGDGAEPVTIDLSGPSCAFLTAGPRRSGVTSTLQVLARAAADARLSVVRLDARPTSPWAGVPAIDVRDGPGRAERFLIDHEGPLVLVAEAPDEDDPLAALLLNYLAVAGPGQHLALGCRLDRAVRSHRGLVREAAAFRTGILLQADAADGHVLDVVLPRRRGQPRPGGGHLVRQGEVITVQVAQPQ